MGQRIPAYLNFDRAMALGIWCLFFLFPNYLVVSMVLPVDWTWELSLGLIIYNFIHLSIFLLICFFGAKKYCKFCNKVIHPLFRDHICERTKQFRRQYVIELLNSRLKEVLNRIKQDIKSGSLSQFFHNDKERVIFKNNMISLRRFEFLKDYKYCMIAMGSVLEFLLIKYCKKNNFQPENHTSPQGNLIRGNRKRFCNYIESAIKNNIFGQKNRWNIVQTNLRNFRNYVHINKEINEEKINQIWYNTIKPVFESLYESFKQTSLNL